MSRYTHVTATPASALTLAVCLVLGAVLGLILLLFIPAPAMAGWDGGHDVVGAADPSDTWYFAEGTTRSGFEEWLCLQNYHKQAVAATVTCMLGDGATVTEAVVLDPHSRTTLDISNIVEEGEDVSVKVEAEKPIVAERPIYFRYNRFWTGGHDILGVTEPAGEWYFAEGSCRPDFDPYLCIQNPGGEQASVKITYMLGDGNTQTQTLAVPPESRETVVVKHVLGEGDDAAHDFSAKVETTNDTQIVAERPMYFNYKGQWPGGHTVAGATATDSVYYFAEGSCRPDFDPYICVQNPGDSTAKVKITYMLGDGGNRRQSLSIAPQSRRTVVVKQFLGEGNTPSYDFSAKVETTNDTEIIAERPMYFDYHSKWAGGHTVVGATAPGTTYFFAEGTCRPGFEPYFCIQNPGGSEAGVSIEYMLGDGTTNTQTLTVAPSSRRTVSVKEYLGEADDAAHDFSARVNATSDAPVVVERPMYFSYASTSKWTLTAVGDVNLGGDMCPTLSANGFGWPWSATFELLQSTTLTFANLECTMSNVGSPVSGKAFTFRGDPAALPAMREAGVDVVSQANNHARDYGGQSLVDCLGYLDQCGIAHCGAGADYEAAHTPAYLEANGLLIAFLAYDEIGYYGWYADPGYPGVADATDTAKMVSDISEARKKADLVVVSIHWGIEKQYTPDRFQASMAQTLVDSGADLVLGHHPHVVQGFQYVGGKMVAFSLGNFVFNPGSPECRYTVLTQYNLDSEGMISLEARPAYISNGRPQIMTGADGEAFINQVAALSQALGTPARVADGVMYIP